MRGLDPRIHGFFLEADLLTAHIDGKEPVDARIKSGHDGQGGSTLCAFAALWF
jgi:hypothetical protein